MPVVRKVRRGSSSSQEKTSRSSRSSLLPDEPNEIPTSLDDVMILVYGRKAIGKSSLCAQFPGNITYMFETGRQNLHIYQIPFRKGEKLDWEMARDTRDEVCGSDRFQRVTIDTAQAAYEACFAWCCSEAGVTHPDSCGKPYELWKVIKAEFFDWVMSFREHGKGVTFVAHEAVKPLITKAKGLRRDEIEESTVKYDRMEPKVTGQVLDVITEVCDYVFYYHYHESKRAIMVRSPYDVAWTACGMGETFLDPDGNPVNTFEAGDTPEKAYQSIIDAFNNQRYDVDYIPPSTGRVSSLRKNKPKK